MRFWERGMSTAQKAAVGLYGSLIVLCVGLLLISNSLSPTVRETILPVAGEGLKTLIAALIGFASALAGGHTK